VLPDTAQSFRASNLHRKYITNVIKHTPDVTNERQQIAEGWPE